MERTSRSAGSQPDLAEYPRQVHCRYCYGPVPFEIADGNQIECEVCGHRLTPPAASEAGLREYLVGLAATSEVE